MAAAAGRPARAEPLGDLLGDLAAGQVGREQAGGGDGAGGAGAVRDHHGPAQAEQDGPAVALRIQPRGQLAQPAALQERADAGGPGGGHRGATTEKITQRFGTGRSAGRGGHFLRRQLRC